MEGEKQGNKLSKLSEVNKLSNRRSPLNNSTYSTNATPLKGSESFK